MKLLAGQWCNDESKTAVRRWFHNQPEEFYNRGISNLVLWWNKYGSKTVLELCGKIIKIRRIVRAFIIACMYFIMASKNENKAFPTRLIA